MLFVYVFSFLHVSLDYPWSVILFQLSQAGLRELEEETGLHLTTDMCENGRVTPLALWEVREHNVRQA